MKIYSLTQIVLLLVCSLCCAPLFGQNADASEKSKGRGQIAISISPSFTWVPQGAGLDNLNDKGHFVPGAGLDIFYRLNSNWEIGTMIDFEFATYVIPRKDDLERERAFVMAAMAAYTISPRWNLFGGAGIEIEKNEDLIVFRLGGEYVIPLHNNWFIPAGAFVDFKPGFQAWSLTVGIGKNL